MAAKSPQQFWHGSRNWIHSHTVFRRPTGPQSLNPKFHIIEVPKDILDNIFGALQVQDQVCFALSCKYLHAHFCSLLHAQKLLLPHLLREERPIVCRHVDIEKLARTQVLRRLENTNWKYCFGCWNLHPYSAWKRPRQHCCLKCQLICGQRCMPYAGIVDICPCLSITKSDLAHLIQDIRLIRGQVHDERRYYYNRLFSHPGLRQKNANIWHSCEVTHHHYAKVEIETALRIGDDNESLIVQNVYQFYALSQTSPPLGICPHEHPVNGSENSMMTIGLPFIWWHNILNDSTLSCYVNPRKGAAAATLEIVTIRTVGKVEWPDKIWDRYSHN